MAFLSNTLEFGAALVAKLWMMPLLAVNLGPQMLGIWLALSQFLSYVAIADMRPSGTLRLSLAAGQQALTDAARRRLVGACVYWSIATLPLVALAAAIAYWALPVFVPADAEMLRQSRYALVILLAGLVLERFISIGHSTLRGSNLEYRGMGVNAAATLATALLMVSAALAGWSLIGVALAAAVGKCAAGLARLAVAVRHVSWFGFARPQRTDLDAFRGRSVWLFVSAIGFLLIEQSDMLLAAWMVGPAAAATLAATGAFVRMLCLPTAHVTSASAAGISGLVGERRLALVAGARGDLQLLTGATVAVAGTSALVATGPFVTLWMGADYYMGVTTTLLIAALLLVSAFTAIETTIADGFLALRAKAVLIFACGIAGIVAGAAAGTWAGIEGMLAATLAARGLLYASLVSVNRRCGMASVRTSAAPWRLVAMTALCWAAAAAAAPRVVVDGWLPLIAVTGATSSAAALALVCGLSAEQRNRVVALLRTAGEALAPARVFAQRLRTS